MVPHVCLLMDTPFQKLSSLMQRTFQKYLPTADIPFKNIMRGIKDYYHE
jgi:hypothetical protein